MQFMILTHLWPWNKVHVIRSGMNWYTPSKVTIMQSLKKPGLNGVREKANFEVFVK